MKLKGFKRRLAAAGIDASFIRRCDITCQQGTGKRMVVVLDSFATDPDGRRFLVFDGAASPRKRRAAATERRVIDLDVFLAAVSR